MNPHWDPSLSELADQLAELYPTPDRRLTLLRNAGLAVQRFPGEWIEILLETRKHDCLSPLIDRVCRDYPNRADELRGLFPTPPPTPSTPPFRDLPVPTLDLLPRSASLAKLKQTLLRPPNPNQRTLITAAAGMGGIGKTVLAHLAMHDPEVRQRFPDGIIALTVGHQPDPLRLLDEIRSIPNLLHQDPAPFTLSTAKERLETLLAPKAILLVVDDVWDLRDVQWLPKTPQNSAILCTTRDSRIATGLKADIVDADYLTHGEAQELLALRAGVATLPPQAAGILRRCKGLALAVSMIGAQLHGLTDWRPVLTLLENDRLSEILAVSDIDEKHRDLSWVTHVSVDALPPHLQQRYLLCAVFPDDTPIPESVFGTLWRDPNAYQTTLSELDRRYLLAWRHNSVTFHDLQLSYLRARANREQRAAANHQTLLHAYQTLAPGHWSTGPNDGYFFQHLLRHLRLAGHPDQADDLLYSLPWLERKVTVTSTNALLADFPEEQANSPLARALRQVAHILDADPKALAAQLLARISTKDPA